MGNFFDDLEYNMGLHYDFDPSTAEELSENPGAPAKIDDNTISETSTYSSSKIEDKISQIVGFKIVIVSQLPQTGEEQTLYLVPSTDPSDANLYNEYMWVDGAWEMVGSTTIDLSNYYTSGQTDEKLEEISFVTSSHINELHDDVDNINTELDSKVGSTSITTIWKGTQAEYDAITTKDNNTFYIITE